MNRIPYSFPRSAYSTCRIPFPEAGYTRLSESVESTEGISQIWFCAPFPPWGVHKFVVMVRFTYG